MAVVEDAGNVVDDGDSIEGVLPSFLIRRLGIWRNGYLDGETPHVYNQVLFYALVLENDPLWRRTHIYTLFEKCPIHPVCLLLDRHRKLVR